MFLHPLAMMKARREAATQLAEKLNSHRSVAVGMINDVSDETIQAKVAEQVAAGNPIFSKVDFGVVGEQPPTGTISDFFTKAWAYIQAHPEVVAAIVATILMLFGL